MLIKILINYSNKLKIKPGCCSSLIISLYSSTLSKIPRDFIKKMTYIAINIFVNTVIFCPMLFCFLIAFKDFTQFQVHFKYLYSEHSYC